MGSGRADLVAQPRGRRFAGVLKGVGSWGFEGFRLFVGFGFKGSGFADLGSPKTLNPRSPEPCGQDEGRREEVSQQVLLCRPVSAASENR